MYRLQWKMCPYSVVVRAKFNYHHFCSVSRLHLLLSTVLRQIWPEPFQNPPSHQMPPVTPRREERRRRRGRERNKT